MPSKPNFITIDYRFLKPSMLKFFESWHNRNLFKPEITGLEEEYFKVIKATCRLPEFEQTIDKNYAIRIASFLGRLDTVELLLKIPSLQLVGGFDALSCASSEGHVGVVERLLQETGIGKSVNRAIQEACATGKFTIVEILLRDPRGDPGADDNLAIQTASNNGYLEIVDCLLKDDRVDPTALGNNALVFANRMGHRHVVSRLMQDKRVFTASLLPENAVLIGDVVEVVSEPKLDQIIVGFHSLM